MTDPTPPGPWGRRPLPARSDWRRALDVYVAGRSRAITHEQKRSIAGTARDESDPGGSGAFPPSVSRYGVSVPASLDFYRNAGTWRNRLPGAEGRDGA